MFKTIALAVFLLVTSPHPELEPRDIKIDCDGKVCKVSQEDMEYIVKRDSTLSVLATRLANLVRACGIKET